MQRESSGALFSYFNNNATGSESGPRARAPSRPAAPARTAAMTSTGVNGAAAEGQDAVTKDKIWRQFLENEQRLDKQWEQNWGFLTDFDPKGNLKTKKALPEQASVFSDKIPNTDAGNYGNRLSTENGQKMAQMQAKFEAQNRRSKPDKDIICY